MAAEVTHLREMLLLATTLAKCASPRRDKRLRVRLDALYAL